jgi:mono/diheme cytochrome c family protein
MKPPSRRVRIALSALAVAAVAGFGAVCVISSPGALNFAGGVPVSLADYRGPSPVGAPPELRGGLIERGAYLARAADCEGCHTADGGQPYAGGRAFPTSFGTLYSPNITADRETGIGAWTDADFIRALHEGVGRRGERLYPAFPYASYTLLTDDDVLAIKAYIISLPAVRATAPPNRLAFPFDNRWLMGLWAALFDPDQRFAPRQDRSPDWNRGAYLVEALAHCGDCHTPRNPVEALDNRRKFAGAVTEGWRAYNITPDPLTGIGGWSDAELASYLSAGHAVGHGSAAGPMAEEVDASLSSLTAGDLRAVVTYLRTVPALRTPGLPAVRTSPAPASPRLMPVNFDPRGKQIFEGACASCHGWSGVSPLSDDATLTGDRAVNDPDAINVAQVVLAGERRRTAHGMAMMPAFGAAYSDAEIAAVANYVTARFGAVPARLSAQDVARLRRLTSH